MTAPRRPRPRTAALVVLALLALLAGASALGQHRPTSTDGPAADDVARAPDPSAATSADVGLTPSAANAALARLPRIDRHPATAPYDRDAFGSPWTDVDGNGCNQRDDVLLRDAVPGSARVAQQGACDHDVLAASFVDPYTGRRLELDDLKDPAQAQAVQIDHVVPLAEAWASGAFRWDDDRRLRFANDVQGLLAVDGPTNASKGADDPAAWRPRAAYQCTYALRWIAVKDRWRLAVDTSEAAALTDLLDRCPAPSG